HCVLIYEGLDFARRPLAAGRVEADLDLFAKRFGSPPLFQIFSKPLVIWSGTCKFSKQDVAQVARKVRSRVLLLASEKDAAGYERLAPLVDGDAYYWSSVDPQHDSFYRAKLAHMSDTVHARGGLWIAPAAPGFDARLVGGHRVVDRRNGQTLRDELNVAISSSPDAIGLISWNEFSENSQVEPSRRYGSFYLRVLADALGRDAPSLPDFDSDTQSSHGTSYGAPVVGGLAAV